MSPATLTRVAPVLLVSDILASVAYWRDQVGFPDVQTYGDPANFAMVHRDGLTLMLCQAPPDHVVAVNWRVVDKIWDVYFWVDNADELYADLQRRNAKIDYTLYDTPYGCREFGIQDLDDHDIAFGQVIRSE